jgi:hypothetical protein
VNSWKVKKRYKYRIQTNPFHLSHEAIWGSITLSSALNIDSEVTVVIGVDYISLATLDKIRYFRVLAFRHSKTPNYKLFSGMNILSSKYISKYDLVGCLPYQHYWGMTRTFPYHPEHFHQFHWLNYYVKSIINLEHCLEDYVPQDLNYVY